jgi:predicted acyltransferase
MNTQPGSNADRPPGGALVQEPPTKRKDRVQSLDAFRGFTILGMVFVIAVAAGDYQHEPGGLPQTMSWFGSLPISTWFHAEVGYELWEDQQLAAGRTEAQIAAMPEHNLQNIGCTFTDLIAPWFVFIVGACIPLSRARRGAAFWRHVGSRTAMLIVMGVIYIALVVKGVSWWWGILQAIGIAYLMGALVCRLPSVGRWVALFVIAAFNLVMTETCAWWTTAFDSAAAFGTLSNPGGDWLRAWTIHCQPWLSISYGVMTIIGVLLGEAIITRDKNAIAKRALLLAAIFMALGYGIHRLGFAIGNYSLCMNKPDVTTSYAFFTSGFGALVFLGFYWVIDVWKVGWWAWPLNVFGVNPLLAYFMQIIMRRGFESLGVIDFFNRANQGNHPIYNWATWVGGGTPSEAALDFFRKSGYHGVMWGLIWTFCLWLIILWCNRKNLFWRL